MSDIAATRGETLNIVPSLNMKHFYIFQKELKMCALQQAVLVIVLVFACSVHGTKGE